MNVFSAKALVTLGHDVKVESYNENISDKIITKIRKIFGDQEQSSGANIRIRKTIRSFKPDLLLTIYGTSLSVKTLNTAKAYGAKTACWWINDPFQFKRGLAIASNFDFWFSNSAICALEIQSLTGVPSTFLPTACDPGIHKPYPFDQSNACDICFAGDWSQSRQKLMEYLLEDGFNIKIYGPWKKKLPKDSILLDHLKNGFFSPEEMCRYFSSAKIVLNFHTWFDEFTHGVNPRLFEAAACGVVQVVDAKKEIPELFNIKEDLVPFSKMEELPKLLTNLLNDNKKRHKIANSALKRVLKDHTYSARMTQLINFVSNKK